MFVVWVLYWLGGRGEIERVGCVQREMCVGVRLWCDGVMV